MPIYRMATQVWYDTLLPRDAMMINPCFNDKGVLSNPGNLATDLIDLIQATFTLMSSVQIRCRPYDVQDTPPTAPSADKMQNANGVVTGATLKEAALCLSFYSDVNRPRNRGRLYIPAAWFLASGVPFRPSVANRDKLGEFAAGLAALGGADVDWGVWSKTDHAFKKASNWFVDDEWDIQRRRGGRATTRTLGTTSG